ncbi:MAG: response regulator [Coxiellaceae bacterium]|nr:response regulator [Coxiellaceae bacterium]
MSRSVCSSPTLFSSNLSKTSLSEAKSIQEFVAIYNDFVRNKVHVAKANLELVYANGLSADCRKMLFDTAVNELSAVYKDVGEFVRMSDDLYASYIPTLNALSISIKEILDKLADKDVEDNAAQQDGVNIALQKMGGLPLTLSHQKVAGRENNVSPLIAKRYQRLELHVLLVDDSKLNHAIYNQWLSQMGCTADSVYNGIGAIEYFENRRDPGQVDVVFMDINMPELNGIETTALLTGRYPDVLIWGVTSDPDPRLSLDEEVREKVKKMAAYYQKPVSASEIYEGLLRLKYRKNQVSSADPFVPPLSAQPTSQDDVDSKFKFS